MITKLCLTPGFFPGLTISSSTSCEGEGVLSHFSHVQPFATSWTVACQAPLSMEFSSQEYWGGFPFPPPEDQPGPGIEPMSLKSSALQGNSLSLAPLGKPVEVTAASMCWVSQRQI